VPLTVTERLLPGPARRGSSSSDRRHPALVAVRSHMPVDRFVHFQAFLDRNLIQPFHRSPSCWIMQSLSYASGDSVCRSGSAPIRSRPEVNDRPAPTWNGDHQGNDPPMGHHPLERLGRSPDCDPDEHKDAYRSVGLASTATPNRAPRRVLTIMRPHPAALTAVPTHMMCPDHDPSRSLRAYSRQFRYTDRARQKCSTHRD
jgi:hypothetical protein